MKAYYNRFDTTIAQALPGAVTARYNDPALRQEAKDAYANLLTLEIITNIHRLTEAVPTTPQNQAEKTAIAAWVLQHRNTLAQIANRARTWNAVLNEAIFWVVGDFPVKAFTWLTRTLPRLALLFARQLKDVALHFPNPRLSARQNIIGFLSGLATLFAISESIAWTVLIHPALLIARLLSNLIFYPIKTMLPPIIRNSGTVKLVEWLVIGLSVWKFCMLASPAVMGLAQVAAVSMIGYVGLGLMVGPIVQLGRAALSLFGYPALDNQKEVGLSFQELSAIAVLSFLPEVPFDRANHRLGQMYSLLRTGYGLVALRRDYMRRDENHNFVSTLAQRQNLVEQFRAWVLLLQNFVIEIWPNHPIEINGERVIREISIELGVQPAAPAGQHAVVGGIDPVANDDNVAAAALAQQAAPVVPALALQQQQQQPANDNAAEHNAVPAQHLSFN